MTLAIIGLLTALIPLVMWWLKRRAAKKENPINQNRERQQTIARDIATGTSDDLTLHAGADLDELERLRRAKAGRDSR